MSNVELIWVTPDAESIIAHNARVSNPNNQDNPDYVKLIKYCLRNSHWSIFDQVNICIEIKTSRAISAQILRHWSHRFQEYCVTGDTVISFDLPNKVSKNKKCHYKMTIEELYTKWHIGAKPIPNRYTGLDQIIPMQDRIKAMNIRVLDTNTNTFINSHISNVYQTGIKDVFEVTLYNGKKIKCTEDHKFLTSDGFIPLKDAVGLKLIGKTATMSKEVAFACNGTPAYTDYKWLHAAKERSILNKTGVQGIADEAGVSYHTIRKWLRKLNLQFTKTEVATYRDIWNKGKFGYTTKGHTEETREKMRKSARHGEKSNLWKGGVDRSERLRITEYIGKYRGYFLRKFNYSCCACGGSKNLELHHIKPVYSHPELAYDLDNIELLCSDCHDFLHNLSGDAKTWREKSSGNKLTVRWSKVKNIVYVGKEMTYDLEVDHDSHNYIANGIVVHNSQRYAEVVDIEYIELRRKGKTNRQSSEDVFDPLIYDDAYNFEYSNASDLVDKYIEHAQWLYKKLVDAGAALETARMILPMASSTTLISNATLRSWIHYLGLRNDEHAQKEHRLIAIEIENILRSLFPIVFAALDEIKAEETFKEDVYKFLKERNISSVDQLKGLLQL